MAPTTQAAPASLDGSYPALLNAEQTRFTEQALAAHLPPYTLMQRAGEATARLALALAPHARTIWLACGPGNNGGDGLEAAVHLAAAGKTIHVTLLQVEGKAPPEDATHALQRARAAGLAISSEPPPHYDLAIDALWGIGLRSGMVLQPGSTTARCVHALLHTESDVLSVDTPSGLLCDTGALAPAFAALAPPAPRGRRFTLSMLGLKPGLFTHQGRDWAGEVWVAPLRGGSNAIKIDNAAPNRFTPAGDLACSAPSAYLVTHHRQNPQAQNTHKGQFGDVGVLGGAPGMEGAALLAASAALHSGAGRVMLHLIGSTGARPSPLAPDIMVRGLDDLLAQRGALACGCGGGMAIAAVLPQVLARSGPVVLDADALNAVAASPTLQQALAARTALGATVLTPHPLELARLLACTAAAIQADRISAARRAARQWQCIVVLKGSGTVIAAPDGSYAINHSGNARLAIGGTGDVLAGCIAAQLASLESAARKTQDPAWQQAWQRVLNAVWLHGHVADTWDLHHPTQPTLTASRLAEALPRQSGS